MHGGGVWFGGWGALMCVKMGAKGSMNMCMSGGVGYEYYEEYVHKYIESYV